MKKQNITLSFALAAVFSSSVAFAEAEVTGKIVHESAFYTDSGEVIGAASATNTTSAHARDLFKTATQAKVFIDGDVADSTYHVELNAFKDFDGIGDADSNESDTQRDFLREAYVDAELKDVSMRIGKQQVVWGTADGMKLLDAINPTDYTEMAQNQMEDSRIPVWMINAETDLANGGNFQLVVSEPKSSVFAGLGKASAKGSTTHKADNADQGHAFKMKGVDSITGAVNGFLNIAPALGKVATFAFGGAHKTGQDSGVLETNYSGAGLTVWDYSNGNTFGTFGIQSGAVLCGAANGNGQNNQVTNLCSTDTLDTTDPDATFEYMSAATFATFDTLGSISSEYRVTDPSGQNVGLRYKGATNNGINYSLNYMNGYDTNPSVDMHWEDGNGSKLYVGTTSSASTGTDGAADLGSTDANLTVRLYTTQALATAAATNTAYNKVDNSGGNPTLVFVESLNKIKQLGGSFDMGVETSALGPIVIRGEALYQKDVESPVIDRKKFGHGDLVGGLSMVEGDYFKYVAGVDITRLTNMMISLQFIQERNLDFIDETQSCHSEYGANCGRYTGDRATLHQSNGLQKAEKNKEFYSVFLSKPFGASGEHRWNNISMFEENGGRWNRFDIEYSINDDVQATAEVNSYFGDANTQFGQLSASNNIQVGVKYSF
jgi:hypothetical protein